MQNAAAGVVTLSPKFCHITPVLANLPWLPTDLRIDFKILIVTYYTLHGLAPAYIQDLLQSYLSARDLRFSKKNNARIYEKKSERSENLHKALRELKRAYTKKMTSVFDFLKIGDQSRSIMWM